MAEICGKAYERRKSRERGSSTTNTYNTPLGSRPPTSSGHPYDDMVYHENTEAGRASWSTLHDLKREGNEEGVGEHDENGDGRDDNGEDDSNVNDNDDENQTGVDDSEYEADLYSEDAPGARRA